MRVGIKGWLLTIFLDSKIESIFSVKLLIFNTLIKLDLRLKYCFQKPKHNSLLRLAMWKEEWFIL